MGNAARRQTEDTTVVPGENPGVGISLSPSFSAVNEHSGASPAAGQEPTLLDAGHFDSL